MVLPVFETGVNFEVVFLEESLLSILEIMGDQTAIFDFWNSIEAPTDEFLLAVDAARWPPVLELFFD